MPETRNLKRTTTAEMQNDEPTLIVANVNQRQGTKKINQRTDKKNKENANEALIYSPLINAHVDHQDQMYQPMVSNMSSTVADDHANMIETKIRSGFFNDHTAKVTSYVDELYIGNQVKFVISYTKHQLTSVSSQTNSRSFHTTTQFAAQTARLTKTNANWGNERVDKRTRRSMLTIRGTAKVRIYVSLM